MVLGQRMQQLPERHDIGPADALRQDPQIKIGKRTKTTADNAAKHHPNKPTVGTDSHQQWPPSANRQLVWMAFCRVFCCCFCSSSNIDLRISPKRVSWSNVVSLIWLLHALPRIYWDSLPIAVMTRSSGVTSGFVMYLCLWNTFPDTLVAIVFVIHISQAW